MSTLAPAKRYTPEDLLTMPVGDRYELVDGCLVEDDTSFWSSYVAGLCFSHLFDFVRLRRLGWVVPEGTTYQCFPHEPNRVRKADVSFLRLDRLSPARAMAESHLTIHPDLAVEVLSSCITAYALSLKVEDYLRAGVSLVWVIDPRARTVHVHRREGTGTILRENDELTGEEVIPGFRCRVGEFFQPPTTPLPAE